MYFYTVIPSFAERFLARRGRPWELGKIWLTRMAWLGKSAREPTIEELGWKRRRPARQANCVGWSEKWKLARCTTSWRGGGWPDGSVVQGYRRGEGRLGSLARPASWPYRVYFSVSDPLSTYYRLVHLLGLAEFVLCLLLWWSFSSVSLHVLDRRPTGYINLINQVIFFKIKIIFAITGLINWNFSKVLSVLV